MKETIAIAAALVFMLALAVVLVWAGYGPPA